MKQYVQCVHFLLALAEVPDMHGPMVAISELSLSVAYLMHASCRSFRSSTARDNVRCAIALLYAYCAAALLAEALEQIVLGFGAD